MCLTISQMKSLILMWSPGNSLTISDVYNYPNPFSGKTTFTFQQNLSKTFDVKIKIYTVAGRLIKVIDSYSMHNKYVAIDWDGNGMRMEVSLQMEFISIKLF